MGSKIIELIDLSEDQIVIDLSGEEIVDITEQLINIPKVNEFMKINIKGEATKKAENLKRKLNPETDLSNSNDGQSIIKKKKKELYNNNKIEYIDITEDEGDNHVKIEMRPNVKPKLKTIQEQLKDYLKLYYNKKMCTKNVFQMNITGLLKEVSSEGFKDTNLIEISQTLDLSSKIYGFRVDKVHSDLVSVVTQSNLFDKENTEKLLEKKEINKKTKKKVKKILSSVNELKRNVSEIHERHWIMKEENLTSDKLFLLKPQHANKGIALNINNDVIMDHPNSSNFSSPKVKFPTINDFRNYEICPKFSKFKFLNWTLDEDNENFSDENHNNYHFDDQVTDQSNNIFNNFDKKIEESFEKSCEVQTKQTEESLVDFCDIISNDNNLTVHNEYSYFPKILFNHPKINSFWKLKIPKKNMNKTNTEVDKANISMKKRAKDILLEYDSDKENESLSKKFTLSNKTKAKFTKKLEKMQDIVFDEKNFYNYFINRDHNNGIVNCNPDLSKSINDSENNQDSDEINNQSKDDNFSNENSNISVNETISDDFPNFSLTNSTISVNTSLNNSLNNSLSYKNKVEKRIKISEIKESLYKKIISHNETFSSSIESHNNSLSDLNSTINFSSSIAPGDMSLSSLYQEISPEMGEAENNITSATLFVSLLHLASEKHFKIIQENLSDVYIKIDENNENSF